MQPLLPSRNGETESQQAQDFHSFFRVALAAGGQVISVGNARVDQEDELI
jgi:hypothetical protein